MNRLILPSLFGLFLPLILAQAQDLGQLRKKLRDPDAKVRKQAMEELQRAKIQAQLSDIVDGLIDCLRHDEDPTARAQAADLLTGIGGPAVREVVPTIIRHLKVEQNKEVRVKTLQALMTTGRDAEPAVPLLIHFLKDEDPLLRVRAAACLCSIGPGAKAAVPALIEALKDNTPPPPLEASIRDCAIMAFGEIGPAANAAVPALFELIKQDAPRIQSMAFRSLGRIGAGDKRVVPTLILLLKSKESVGGAAFALGLIGPDHAKEAIPVLIQALDLSHPSRKSVILALGEMGPEAKAVVPILIQIVKEKKDDDDTDLRSCAAYSLGKMGPAAKEAIPVLTEVLREKLLFSPLRETAREALELIQKR